MEDATQLLSWDKDNIKNSLHSTICRIVFTKADGTERVMHCTLSEAMIPQVTETVAENKKTKKDNPDVQAVYDVEAKGWRSFRWDSLKDFRAEMNL
jgi:hypothetical protein